MVSKASVTLDNVPLAATSPIAWQFTAGVAPYVTTFSVHRSLWERQLRARMGKPLVLRIEDSRGNRFEIQDVYILHIAPSDSPHRIAFVVADRRWKWTYKLIARDFNMPRKTGSRTAKFSTVPVETRQTFDVYDYLPYSLNNGERWTAKAAVEHVLELLETETLQNKTTRKRFRIDSFPIDDKKGNSSDGQFTIQSIMLRDPGDVSLAKLLSFIPGADLFVDASGTVVVYDAADLDATETYFRSLPPSTWDGDSAAWINRAKIRPAKVRVHYQREVEVVFDFSDDYGGTTANPGRDTPFLENVLPTVDPETEITAYDPEANATITKTVPPGTWVPVLQWLAAMNNDRPPDSLPWTFETIKRHWFKGDLDGVLGARGLDLDEEANVAMRVQALKQHFRQTFRINRRYMERVRDLRAIRVALLDPVTGARAPSAVWGQACVVPTTKGQRMASRKPGGNYGVNRNVDYLAPSAAGAKLIDTAPGPASVNLVDRDLGIFRVEWIVSPYGDVESFLPCHLVGSNQQPTVVSRDLSQQDDKPMGAGIMVESGTNGIFLRDTLRLKVIMTIVPSAPNNERQFHIEEMDASRVATVFANEYRIQGGEGPDLDVFIPPGEATARFGWDTDNEAAQTVEDLLGLKSDDPQEAGIDGTELPGFVLTNEERHLTNHAISVAAEMLAGFADNVQGVVVTTPPRSGVKIVGNIASATVKVATAPSAKVDTVHVFPGQQRRLSRFAMMSDAARSIVLGTIPFKAES